MNLISLGNLLNSFKLVLLDHPKLCFQMENIPIASEVGGLDYYIESSRPASRPDHLFDRF